MANTNPTAALIAQIEQLEAELALAPTADTADALAPLLSQLIRLADAGDALADAYLVGSDDGDEPSGYKPEAAALYNGTPGSGSRSRELVEDECEHGYALGCCRACDPDGPR